MIFATGLSYYSVAFFHLANHALFKALLFLSAGSIIHGLSDEQDLRRMGSLLRYFPISYTTILIGSLALVGFPFLTGFYSKDIILEIAVSKQTVIGNFSHILGCIAACCTSFYSFRLIFLVFINNTNTYKNYVNNIHESNIIMVFPLILLSIGSIFFGFLAKDLFIGLGTSSFSNTIYVSPLYFNFVDSEFLNSFIKNLPFIFTILGFVLSLLLINCFNVANDVVLS